VRLTTEKEDDAERERGERAEEEDENASQQPGQARTSDGSRKRRGASWSKEENGIL